MENRTEHLEALTEVGKLTITAMPGFPASTAFGEPMVHNERASTLNQGKTTAFMAPS